MGNYHAPFWRAVGEVTPSLTLILNAAINLKQEAVRLTVLACGLDSADTNRMLAKRTQR